MDLLITGGTVVTMDDRRAVIEDGALAIEDGTIRAVGPASEVATDHEAERTIDATGHAVLPGFVCVHAHVSDILLRGLGNDKSLYDWLFNIKIPGTAAMTPEEHAVASALYAREAIAGGVTTVVEFGVGEDVGYDDAVLEAKFDVYRAAGLRNVYAQSFTDREPDEAFAEYVANLEEKEPAVAHVAASPQDTDRALAEIESRIEAHADAEGQSVWPAPVRCFGVSPEGLRGAVSLAEDHDVMTTTHVSESPVQDRHLFSNVEYLHNAGYLGERTLLAHCVCLDDRDLRALRATDTRVAHNPLTNLALGDGIAPVPRMLDAGMTVGIGMDNPSASDTVTMAPHLRAAAMIHKGARADAGAITAEKVLEMATIDAARAIGRGEDLGSLEPGKAADAVLVELEGEHATPHTNLASALIYQSQGADVSAVIRNGEVIMEDQAVPGIDDRFPALRERATDAAAAVIERAGLEDVADRGWMSHSGE